MRIMRPIPARFLLATLCWLSLHMVGQADAAGPQASPAEPSVAAAEALQRKCDAKDWAACVKLGDEYNYSEYSESNKSKAFALYRRACDAKFANGCAMLGLMYETGSGVAKDPGKAVALYRQACDANDLDGCQSLALAYRKGEGVPKDVQRAIALLQQACDRESGNACYMLAGMYQFGEGVAKDEAKSEALVKRACKLGSSVCQIEAYETAVRPYDDDCRNGGAEACYMIGGAYQYGYDHLKVNYDLAASFYGEACDRGHAKACFILGVFHFEGVGVAKDPIKANDLFRKAGDLADKSCAGNSKTAVTDCRTLGTIYEFGLGVAPDPARAKILYGKSCQLGDKEACGLQVADAAAPQPKPAVAAAATQAKPTAAAAQAPTATPAAKPASGACKVARVQVGVDTVASVERDILARGGFPGSVRAGSQGIFIRSDLSGDYRDVGTNIMAVNYDFDAAGPTGRLIAVRIANHANSGPDYEKLLAERKAAVAAIAGPLQQKSATEFVASAPGCQLRLLPNADTLFIHEVYQLPN
jgi:TPR repeat protein